LAFAESKAPMSGETKQQFEQILGKMSPEVAKGFLADLEKAKNQYGK